MKKKILFTTLAACLLGAGSCKKDSEFLNDVQPIGINTIDATFNDAALTLAAIGRLYNAEVDFSGLDNNWSSFTDFGESFASENSHATQGRNTWAYDSWANWDYTYIREINLFMERLAASTALSVADKTRFNAEARFLRAAQYFELVKRMGGVPIITKSIVYESGPVSAVQFPRSKESEVYDFILSELDALKDILPKNPASKSRATAGACLAMATRAAVYAGSIAKYGINTPTVTLPGDVVGIPAAMASGYYTKALASAQLLMGGTYGTYRLYSTPVLPADNFAAIFTDKTNLNNEAIYIEDFKVFAGKVHGFTTNDQPYSNGEEIDDAGRLNPTLNIVQAFEKTDGTFAPFVTRDGAGAPAYYDAPGDIYAGRDGRLQGTVLIPGAVWKGAANDIWAGYWTPSATNPVTGTFEQGTITTSDVSTNLKPLPGTTVNVQVTGADGPSTAGIQYHTQTGFYIRKWLDPNVGTGRRGQGSDIPFIRYRYSEVLLNAAEAAAELGQYPLASGYINQVRTRAGITVPLVLSAANYFDRIVHERRVEFAFEGLNIFDYKRWRIATQVWDGQNETLADLTTNLASATHRNTKQWGLWPYKVYAPTNPAINGKWIFKETVPGKAGGTLQFRLGNYYSQISDAILGNNPKLLRQPNQ